MFKNINFKNVLLAILTCLTGFLTVDKGVEVYSTPGDRVDEPKQYFEVVAQFCVERPLELANFKDTYVDGILVESFKTVAKPTKDYITDVVYSRYPLLKKVEFCGYLKFQRPDGSEDFDFDDEAPIKLTPEE